MSDTATIRGHAYTAEMLAVCMGMDAMRLAMGKPPRNFKAEEILRWLHCVLVAASTSEG